MTSRRRFLATLPALGATATLPAFAASQSKETVERLTLSVTESIPLRAGWIFRLDPTGSHDPDAELSRKDGWQNVTVPHTWQSMAGSPDYVGAAGYKIDFFWPPEWQHHFLRVEFEAVFIQPTST